jgi:ABC-type sugar transport system ATPase subunit
MAAAAVRFEGITKTFPGVTALSDVTLDIADGSCHALCGENGAGKSTLGKILAGIYRPDAGQLIVRGLTRRFGGPRDALAAGIGMVHQELAFCANLSVAENLCLGSLPTRRGLVSPNDMVRQARDMLTEIGTTLDVARPLGELTVAQQQLVQIASAVGGGARIIIFDEPTSSLSQADTQRLYELIERLKERGVTCIYVSHRMPEIFRICDAVSVLRDGRHVATRPVSSISQDELIQLVIGRPLSEYFPGLTKPSAGAEVLRGSGLSSPGKFQDVSFAVRAGEVVGLAGLVGAGRSELANAIFGLDKRVRGELTIDGRPVRLHTPRDAIRHGVGLVPEDRKRQGILPFASALHNISLATLKRLSHLTWLRLAAERVQGRTFFDRLRVRAPNIDSVVAGLSGGNQQKVVLARWLAARSRLLILDEPTRGVDVGAKAEIHGLIRELAAQGTAILLISSELPEILSLSDRILVLRAGRLVGEVPRESATQEGLLRLMAGLSAA